MSPLRVHTHIGPDGTLTLRLPAEFQGVDVRVTVEPEPRGVNGASNGKGRRSGGVGATEEPWSEFLRRVSGSIDDETFERPPQDEPTPREPLD